MVTANELSTYKDSAQFFTKITRTVPATAIVNDMLTLLKKIPHLHMEE